MIQTSDATYFLSLGIYIIPRSWHLPQFCIRCATTAKSGLTMITLVPLQRSMHNLAKSSDTFALLQYQTRSPCFSTQAGEQKLVLLICWKRPTLMFPILVQQHTNMLVTPSSHTGLGRIVLNITLMTMLHYLPQDYTTYVCRTLSNFFCQ